MLATMANGIYSPLYYLALLEAADAGQGQAWIVASAANLRPDGEEEG